MYSDEVCMREIFSYENVMISVEHLLTKGDSCGEDGIYVSQFREYWDLNSTILLNNVWSNTYVSA